MKTGNLIKYISVVCVITVFGLFAYLVHASNMISYLSNDPKACINCHTMNTQYATWQHSAHREKATCVDCHLPRDSFIDKIVAKSRDGYNHSIAMTFKTYKNNIRISDNAAKRIQANCISCHREMVSQMAQYSSLYTSDAGTNWVDRNCWGCHRKTPHGLTRSITSTPDNIGVKEL